jgi:gliding motility-associated-like protein
MVNPLIRDTTIAAVCSNQLPYRWKGRLITLAGVYMDTTKGLSGCDTISRLQLTISATIRDTSQAAICINRLPYIWRGRNLTTTGNYLDTIRGTTGCDTISMLQFRVDPVLRDTLLARVCSNRLPYLWRGRNITAAGFHYDTIPGTTGCDTYSVLQLSIDPVVRDTGRFTICSNRLPWIWHGMNYVSAGTYRDTIRGITGCDTLAVLFLTVNPVIRDTTRVTVCTSRLPYIWKGRSYPTAGTYLDTIRSAVACDTLAVLQLIVTPVIRDTLRTSICSNQLPYPWKGNIINAAGIYVDTLPGTVGCDTIAVLQLTVAAAIRDTLKITACADRMPYLWRGTVYNVSGTYLKTISGTSGCDTLAVLQLTVTPVIRDTTRMQVCTNRLPYTWRGRQFNVAGIYRDTLRAVTGCDTLAVLQLSVTDINRDTIRVTVCQNRMPYIWKGKTYVSAGIYRDTSRGVIGCDTISMLQLAVNPVIRDTTRASICSNQLPYRWKGQTYTSQGTFNLTISGTTGCDTLAVLQLMVSSVVRDTTRVSLCSNQLPYRWKGNDYNSAGTWQRTLTGTSGCDTLAVLLLSVSDVIRDTTRASICSDKLPYIWRGNNYTNAGIHLRSITGTTGCDTAAVLLLTINPILRDTTRAKVCSNNLPYVWKGSGYTSSGTYQKTRTGTIGCDTISVLFLTVDPVVRDTTRAVVCTNRLPYRWKGKDYLVSGNFLDTLKSATACDTFAVLQLTVNPVIRDTTRLAICSNQLPYLWKGVTYSAAGNYQRTLTGVIGCDTLAVLQLTVNAVLRDTTRAIVCSDRLPYLWNGNNYTTPGTYLKTIPGAGGCDTYAVLQLTVDPLIRDTTRVTLCSDKLPYLWKGNAYSAAGNYPKTTPGTTGCDTISVLLLNVNPVIRDTTRTSVCADRLPYRWKGSVYMASGTYLDTLTGTNTCDTFAVLILTVNPVIRDTLRASVCTNRLPFRWKGIDYTSTGTYLRTLTGTNTCDTFAVLQLQVNDVIRDTTNAVVCANRLPYIWKGNAYATAGTFLRMLPGNGSCDTFAVLNLSVVPLLRDTTKVSVCANALPVIWRGRSLNTPGIFTDTARNTSSGCDTLMVIQLTVLPLKQLTIVDAICANQLPYRTRGRTFMSAGNYSFTVAGPPGGCDTAVLVNLSVLPLKTDSTFASVCANRLPYRWKGRNIVNSGIYIDTLRGPVGGCDTIAYLRFTVDSLPRDTSRLIRCSNQLPFTWRGNLIQSAGTYIDTISAASGCDTIAVLLLAVNPVVSSLTRDTICANRLPYIWNGRSLTATGNYQVTLRSTAGCDSLTSLALVVNPIPSTDTRVVICSNQLPYLWNGRSYAAAGNHQAVLRSYLGCDSLANLQLIVNPVVGSTTRISICSDRLPYQWNGNTYTAAGTYAVTFKSHLGCDSIATLQLSVNPVVSTVSDVVTCSNQLPYVWNGQTYAATGRYSVTLKTYLGCDSIANLNLVVYPVVSSVSYRETCVNQLPFRWNGQSYTATGTYQVILRSSYGCDSVATLMLTVHPLAYSTTNVTLCSNQVPFSWNSRQYERTGTYQAILRSHLGCDSIATLNLIVNPVVYSTTDVSVCADQLPYRWNGNAYPTAGNYSVTLRSHLNCDSIATLRLSVRQLTYSTTIDTICTSQIPYLWNSVPYIQSGVYTYKTINAQGCDSIATLRLTIVPLPKVTVTGKDSVCTGLKAYFTVTFTGRPPWSITYREGTVITTVSGITRTPYTLVLSPTANTTYTFLQATDALCLNDSINISRSVFITYPVPGARLRTVNVLANTPVTLKSRNLGWTYTYLWQPGTGLNNPIQANPIFNHGRGQDYLIRMTSGAGCETTDTLKVMVYNNTLPGETPDLLVPKAWTPDNDGHNDELFPFTINIRELKYFRIFNRWGQLMFETRELGKGWNGIFKGQPQPIDAYTWTVEGIGTDGTVIRKAGNSALLR